MLKVMHPMDMVQRTDEGFEEWVCPICGRRILLSWPPRDFRQVLHPGDETVTHTGTKPRPWPRPPQRFFETAKKTFDPSVVEGPWEQYINSAFEGKI